jgi:hypothetical protein
MTEKLIEDSAHDSSRITTGDARKMALLAWELHKWEVDMHSVRQFSKDKIIGHARYRGKLFVIIMTTYGSMMLFTQDECQLLGIKALEVWPDEESGEVR